MTGRAGFTQLPAEATGILFTNYFSDELEATNRIWAIGSGVALGDVDGDGWCDIYFNRLDGPNVLFHNLGNWRFEDITPSAGVACPGQFSTGAVFADLDGDGDLDLLVNAIGGGTRCFLNDGHGHFSEVTDSGLIRRFGSTSMALADIEGDGDLDLYVANYRTTTMKDAPPGVRRGEARMVNGRIVVTPADRYTYLTSRAGGVMVIEKGEPDVLYINKGQGHFGRVSWTAGAFVDESGQPLAEAPQEWGLSVMFRDMNEDGAPDIYVCNDFFFSPDRVWLNEAGRRFRSIARLALRNMPMSSMSIDFADINRDGHDDFFITDMLSRRHSARQRQRANVLKGELNLPIGDLDYRPEVLRNTLYLNRGDGTYAEIAQLSGLAASEWTWSVIFLDVDLDGYEDLLIATGNNHDVLDADTLREIALPSAPSDAVQRLRRFERLETPNLLYRNQGDLTFKEVGAEWGFNADGISQGMALADLDNDGDLDVVLNNLNAAAGVYRNDSVAPRLAVRLQGLAPNRQGIGAKIRVWGGPVPQSQEMICGGRYLSGDEAMRVFAAGAETNELQIEVTWRSGKQSVVKGAKANCIYEIDEAGAVEARNPQAGIRGSDSQVTRLEGLTSHDPQITNRQPPVTSNPSSVGSPPRAGGAAPPDAVPRSPSSIIHHPSSAPRPPPQPVFQDVSELLGHTHADEPFDDFARQPLLGQRLSQLGPGVAWHDIDQDGWDDLIIGTGRGGRLRVYRNNGKGGFSDLLSPPIPEGVASDQTAILGLTRRNGQTVLLVGSSNYEDGLPAAIPVRQYDFGRKVVDDTFPKLEGSVGPMALSDIDGDGDLDLFVGGRVVPGRYPEPATSKFFRNTGGGFHLDAVNNPLFEKVGLVSGAVFSDLDGDGDGDLVLACEWGPVRVFRNDSGKFVETTEELGLATYTGWWNGVATGDLDGDGRLDLIASNWGRNSKYQSHLQKPLRLYYADFDGNGTLEVVEAYFDAGMNKWVPWRDYDTMSKAIPQVPERFSSFRAYGHAGVEELLGDQFPTAKLLQAATLDSMVFMNRGGRFEARPLPLEAQFAPAFGVVVADYDGDGNEDVFLSQNFFDVEPETSRYDGGRGLWLRGDGKGGFHAVPGQESGVKAYGEQRGCASADFDGDGRVDLVVTQNSHATKLYRNAGAKPGLRVRANAGPGNPTGVGVAMRLEYGPRQGPVREVQAGSGYWSQNSAVQVLGNSEKPTRIWVRWPGGKVTIADIAPEAKEIEVSLSGNVTLLR